MWVELMCVTSRSDPWKLPYVTLQAFPFLAWNRHVEWHWKSCIERDRSTRRNELGFWVVFFWGRPPILRKTHFEFNISHFCDNSIMSLGVGVCYNSDHFPHRLLLWNILHRNSRKGFGPLDILLSCVLGWMKLVGRAPPSEGAAGVEKKSHHCFATPSNMAWRISPSKISSTNCKLCISDSVFEIALNLVGGQ